MKSIWSELTPHFWFGIFTYVASVIGVIVVSWFGLTYGLADVRKNLEKHMEDDQEAFAAVGVKLDTIAEGIQDIQRQIGVHGEALGRHDERTTANSRQLERIERRLERV